jgi:putative transcriptional regulator
VPAKPEAKPAMVCTLNELLADRGITGRQLAEMAGVTEATVSKLRRNTFVSIDAATFARVCACLKVQPGDLLRLKAAAD